MKLEIPENLQGKKLFKFLAKNHDALVAQKKFEIKKADAVFADFEFITAKGKAVKAAEGDNSNTIPENATKLKARLIINTTNLLDSHSDVHIPGLWSKSLSESNLLYLLQEHEMTFANIITDEVNASAKYFTWQELGAQFQGKTQALVFDVIVQRKRNPYMFDQYREGYVKNHSVGMRYIKIYLCINDETDPSYASYKDNWDKYRPQIVNGDQADDQGYFWAVTEAKVIEGSAVPIGSNRITPTQSISESKQQPVKSTRLNDRNKSAKPVNSTQLKAALKQLEKKLTN